jgi:prepilin-type N-terminal cleavage/methylation domain-containing protein
MERARLSRSSRRGLTLLELAAVVALVSLMAGLLGMRLRSQSLSNLGARIDARCLASDLIQARRRAITTGENHVLVFRYRGGRATEYTLCARRSDGSLAPVEDTRVFPAGVLVTATPDTPEFDARGLPLAAYQIALSGPNLARHVTVAEATGSVYVTEP